MSITIDEMRDKLLTLDDIKERVAPTEGLSSIDFDMTGEAIPVKFKLPLNWNEELKVANDEDVTEAVISIGGTERQLTKGALLKATSMISLPIKFVEETPSELVEPILNYRYSHGKKELKLLTTASTGYAFTTSAHNIYSNLRLIKEAEDAIHRAYGDNAEILVDYKFTHTLDRTSIRLIVPSYIREIASARAEKKGEDPWSAGVAINSSLIGSSPLSVEGYQFAWVCTNGATNTLLATGKHKRKKNEDVEMIYDWVGTTIDQIFIGMEDAFDAIAEMPSISLEDQHDMSQTMVATFDHYGVPLDARKPIMTNLVETDDLSAYGLMQAITAAANSPELSGKQVSELLDIGGHLPHAMASRCEACHRF